jgi:cbb3-type cytochrome oxidase maturation protein
MYYPYFIAYMAVGFIISLVVFFWALNSGQFRDQRRARFIPLESERTVKPAVASRFARIQSIALFALVCVCLASSIAVIAFSLIKAAR